MSPKISDAELLEELKARFETNMRILREQNHLLEQLRSVNEKLLASERMKSVFLSNIRNEINNPVASILGLSKSITDDNVDIATIRRFARLIHSEVFNLDFQLRNIFLSAEVEAGEAQPCVSAVQVVPLVESVVKSYRSQITDRYLDLQLQFGISSGHIFHTDPEKLHLILSNLLSNAVRYNRDGGMIIIGCTAAADQLMLSVTDTGVGIAEKNRAKVFDRFWQVEHGSNKTYSGHGLGLSITKALVEMLGGSITLESEEGKGSCAVVRLKPLEAAPGEFDIFSSDGNDFLFADKMTF